MKRSTLLLTALLAGASGCQSDGMLGVWQGDLSCEHETLGGYDIAAEIDFTDGGGANVSGYFRHDAETAETGAVFSWFLEVEVEAALGGLEHTSGDVDYAVVACQSLEASWDDQPWYTACDQVNLIDFQADNFQLNWNNKNRFDYEDDRCEGVLTR